MSERRDSNDGKGDGDFEKWLRDSVERFEEEEMKALGFESATKAAGDDGNRPSKTAPDLADSSAPSAEPQKAAGDSSECASPVEGEGGDKEAEPDGRESERPIFFYLEEEGEKDEDDEDDEDKKGISYEELQKLFERARPKRDEEGIRTPDEIPEIVERLESEDEDEFISCDEVDEDDVEEFSLDEILSEDEDKPADEEIRIFHGDDGSVDEASGGSLLPDEGSDMEERLRHLREDALNGSPEAIFTIAVYVIRGYRMRRSVAEGIALLGIAASLGSEDARDALVEINEDDRVTRDVYHDGIIVYAEPSSRDIKIEGEAWYALGWADFKVSLAYLMGETLFKSTSESERWENMARDHGCYLIRTYEDLEYKYGNKCDRLARALERAADAARGEKERKTLQRVCDDLDDALFEVNLAAFRLFETPEFMDEYDEMDNLHESACHCLESRMTDAENTLREIGGDDGE